MGEGVRVHCWRRERRVGREDITIIVHACVCLSVCVVMFRSVAIKQQQCFTKRLHQECGTFLMECGTFLMKPFGETSNLLLCLSVCMCTCLSPVCFLFYFVLFYFFFCILKVMFFVLVYPPLWFLCRMYAFRFIYTYPFSFFFFLESPIGFTFTWNRPLCAVLMLLGEGGVYGLRYVLCVFSYCVCVCLSQRACVCLFVLVCVCVRVWNFVNGSGLIFRLSWKSWHTIRLSASCNCGKRKKSAWLVALHFCCSVTCKNCSCNRVCRPASWSPAVAFFSVLDILGHV